MAMPLQSEGMVTNWESPGQIGRVGRYGVLRVYLAVNVNISLTSQ